MKVEQVRNMMIKMCPGRSVCVARRAWYYSGVAEKTVEYRVSVLPGYDGKDCQGFGGESFDACLTLLREAIGAATTG